MAVIASASPTKEMKHKEGVEDESPVPATKRMSLSQVVKKATNAEDRGTNMSSSVSVSSDSSAKKREALASELAGKSVSEKLKLLRQNRKSIVGGGS